MAFAKKSGAKKSDLRAAVFILQLLFVKGSGNELRAFSHAFMAIDEAWLRLSENRVLLCCARASLAQPGEFAAALGEVRDWPSLLARLQRHRLLLLFHHLAGHEALVPEAVLLDVTQMGERALHQNLLLLAELQEVTAFLDARGIRVLSYKGPSVALSAYGSIALRSFVDLDLLISPRDRKSVVSALTAYGFRQSLTPLSPFVERFKNRHGYEMLWSSADALTLLDVHWNVVPQFESFPLNFEQMWQHRVVLGSVAGVSTLCREDLILALCFHGLKHGWRELEWIGCLLALLLTGRDDPLNWRRLETLARTRDCGRILGLGLRLAMDLSEVGGGASPLREIIPRSLWRRVGADKGIENLAARMWKTVLGPAGSEPFAFSLVAEELMLGLRGRRRFVARSKYLFGALQAFLVSLERSRMVLALAAPWLRFLPAPSEDQ